MPPRKRAKPSAPQTEEDELVALEASRLRSRAEHRLLQKSLPTSSVSRIPSSLRKSDGADIVKRNASRKKKYLLLFPGAASLPPGARIGDLTGLDTRNPTLYVDFPPLGRIKMHGSLVFPKNCFTTIKGSSSAKKSVQVVDTFETLVVFSEWAWVGDESNNPGHVPEPIPGVLKRGGGEVPELWKTDGMGKEAQAAAKGARDASAAESDTGTGSVKKGEDAFVVDDVVESPIVLGDEEEDDVIELVDDSDGDSDEWERSLSRSVDASVEPRSNPKRKRKRVNYAQMEEEEDDAEDGDAEEREGEDKSEDDDDPGYELGANLDDSRENGANF